MKVAKHRVMSLYNLWKHVYPVDRCRWFYRDVETHFEREKRLDQLENWLTTYEPMIRRKVREKARTDIHRQPGEQIIDDIFTPVGAIRRDALVDQ